MIILSRNYSSTAACAPPLDDAGNSVKAQAAIKYIARELGVNVFSGDTVEIIK